jgi:hypothetical protein
VTGTGDGVDRAGSAHAVGAASRVPVPADVDAPDAVAYGLTFRQLAVLAVAAVAGYGGWRAVAAWLPGVVPGPVLAGAAVVWAGVALGVALGRRDGQPLDVWLAHAVRFAAAPRAYAPGGKAGPLPGWVERPPGRAVLPAPLRLPATAITPAGHITLDPGSPRGARRAGRDGRRGDRRVAVLVAAGTVGLGLRTPAEQDTLVEAYGRWLNSLTDPVQITVSTRPVDLAGPAATLTARAAALPHPALRAACADHARFLRELAAAEPLHRQVLLTHTSPVGSGAGGAAGRVAAGTAQALAGLGIDARVLDGPAVTAVLAAAADPYQPPPGTPLPPDPAAPITATTVAAVADTDTDTDTDTVTADTAAFDAGRHLP